MTSAETQLPQAPAYADAPQPTVLDQIVREGRFGAAAPEQARGRGLVRRFVEEVLQGAMTVGPDTEAMINQRIAEIDRLVSAQVGEIMHHAQALLARGRHHAALDRFLRDADRYRQAHAADLVADLAEVHRDLGLARELPGGVTVLAHLTPIKERELLVVGRPGMDERDPAFTDAVWRALSAYRDRLGVRSFNLALWRAPLAEEAASLPPMVRMVDRGDPMSRPSDIGAMELYGTPIVGSDPYDVIAAFD